MLALFRTNQASASLLLLFYALLLQLPVWVGAGLAYASTDYTGGGIIGTFLAKWMNGRTVLNYLLPVLLLFLQGVLATSLVRRHRLSRKVTLFPGLFLMLAWALVPALRTFHPAQFAMVFVLLGLLSLASSYKKPQPAVPYFNAGAWLGLAVLCVPAAVVLLPAFVIGIGSLNRPEMRHILQLLTGLLVIVFLVFSLAYFWGGLAEGWRWQLAGWGLPALPAVMVVDTFGLLLAGLLLMGVIGASGLLVRLLGIEGSKNVSILYFVLFFGGVGFAVSAETGLGYLLLVLPVIGILLGLWFNEIKNRGQAELFHLLLFAAGIGGAIYTTLSAA